MKYLKSCKLFCTTVRKTTKKEYTFKHLSNIMNENLAMTEEGIQEKKYLIRAYKLFQFLRSQIIFEKNEEIYSPFLNNQIILQGYTLSEEKDNPNVYLHKETKSKDKLILITIKPKTPEWDRKLLDELENEKTLDFHDKFQYMLKFTKIPSLYKNVEINQSQKIK